MDVAANAEHTPALIDNGTAPLHPAVFSVAGAQATVELDDGSFAGGSSERSSGGVVVIGVDEVREVHSAEGVSVAAEKALEGLAGVEKPSIEADDGVHLGGEVGEAAQSITKRFHLGLFSEPRQFELEVSNPLTQRLSFVHPSSWMRSSSTVSNSGEVQN